MKTSEIWKIVYENITIKYCSVWESPIKFIDMALEKEFKEVRN